MINTNAYKELPFTMQLDWRTGNTLLNFHQIQCKVTITKEIIEAVKSNRRLFEVHGGQKTAKKRMAGRNPQA